MSEQPAQEKKPAKELTPEEAVAAAEKKKADKEAKKEAAKAEKAAREAKKADRLAARQAKGAADAEFVKDPNDPCAHLFGDKPLCRSECDPEDRFKIIYTAVKDLTAKYEGKEVRIRGRLHNSHKKKKVCFVVVRESYTTVQAVLFVGENISKGMVTYSSKVPKESIIEVVGTVAVPKDGIAGCSQQVELQVKEFWCVNKSVPMLPFQIEDASRQVLDQTAEFGKAEGVADEQTKEGDKLPVVKQDVRLNNRIIDLRVPTNQAIFRLQSGVCKLYRDFLISRGFVEIHSPKLISGSSEGGANVFHFKYFDKPGCLAQSPQLYKQMALCGDLQRVFEIGPVFRAEDSNTNRHLCEFTGLDMEMEFKNHYFEVLDLIGEMLVYMFECIAKDYARELSIINEQYPFEPFKCANPIFKMSFKEGVKLLQEAGYDQDPLEDLSTETEKALGRIVREKQGTDFYMLYGYPVSARPFYTMLDPNDPNYTNSYDFFMRGEEITSGAQRIHDPEMLTERAQERGLDVATIKDYISAFKYGVPNHAGAGFGLERIVKLYCNLHNIRKTSMFPRDPQRLAP